CELRCRLPGGVPLRLDLRLRSGADRHLCGHRRAGARLRLQRRLGAALDGPGLGRSGAGDPAFGARRRSNADRGGAGGGTERHPPASHGGLAAAADQGAAHAPARPHPAGTPDGGEHVGGIAASPADAAASAALRLLQRARRGLHVHRAVRHGRRLLSRRLAAAPAQRRPSVPHPDVVPGVHRAQHPRARRRRRAWARPHRLPVPGLRADRPRPDVDRHRRRIGRLSRAPPARGAAMSAQLWPYLLLILVGFLPNEIWRMLGIVAAHGLDEDSEIVLWVRAVATAVLAGVIAKIVLWAPGALADVPVTVRLAAIGLGFATFVVARRSVFAGVAAGEAALIVGAY